MYIPESFRIDDQEIVDKFLTDYPFATLVSKSGGDITHMPLIRRPDGRLEGHFAGNNPHRKMVLSASDMDVVAVFHGPHAYISPTWYAAGQEAVPTWNYASVHVHGVICPFATDQELQDHFHRLVEVFEGERSPRWSLTNISQDFFVNLSRAVVGFSIEMHSIEAKFKLGQNRKSGDILGFINALSRSNLASDRDFADFASRFTNRD